MIHKNQIITKKGLIIGVSTGIGLNSGTWLAARGVTIIGRSQEKLDAAAAGSPEVTTKSLDLESDRNLLAWNEDGGEFLSDFCWIGL